MPSNKKKGRKFRLNNGSICAISLLIWLGATILISDLTGNICKNCSLLLYEISLWISKAINVWVALNILAMAEVLTTTIKTKRINNITTAFRKYESSYAAYAKNNTDKTDPLDNLLKKMSLLGMTNKSGRYLGFLLLRYLK